MSDKTFTTGEVAKFVGVNFRTVIRWIERGELEGYKLPGRGDHRVTLNNLLLFLKKHAIPVPEELAPKLKKALVVDDDHHMAKAIARVLKSSDWDVSIALDGFEAGMLLSSDTPSLITLDLSMPYMNGFHVLRLIRDKYQGPEFKILVISALSSTDLDKALSLGADAIIEKPFLNEDIKQQLSSWFS